MPLWNPNPYTINGLRVTTTTGTFTLANDKTFTVSNTLTLTGTDGSSIAFGAGGTVLYSGGAISGTTGLFSSTLGVSGIFTASATVNKLGAGAQASYPLEVAGTNGNGIRYRDTTNTVDVFVGAYNSRALIGTITNHPLDLYVNNTAYATLSTTALAVTGGLSATTRIDFPAYTVGTLPAVGSAGGQIYVSNEAGGAVPAFSDGTNWRRVTDRAVVS